MKRFLRGEAEKYPAAEVMWIPGYNPEAEFLDIRRNVVEKVPLAKYTTEGIHQLLAKHGITKTSPKPAYLPK